MPKLTLRDLFAVVTIVALALGWWVDRSQLRERAERAEWMYSKQDAAIDTLLSRSRFNPYERPPAVENFWKRIHEIRVDDLMTDEPNHSE